MTKNLSASEAATDGGTVAASYASALTSPRTIGVVRLASGWTIITGGRRWGRFAHRVDAEEAGLRLAADALARGGSVRVLVQTPFGELEELSTQQMRAAG